MNKTVEKIFRTLACIGALFTATEAAAQRRGRRDLPKTRRVRPTRRPAHHR